MEELHEVTRQYLSCSNPVEAAARRQRVLYGDANGQMEDTARAIIHSAKNRQSLSNLVRGSESNPVTPPPLQGPYFQPLLLLDTAGYTPPDRTEVEPIVELPYSDVEPVRELNSPINHRGEPARMKSIIISPQAEENTTQSRSQAANTTQEEEETLQEFQNKIKRKLARQTRPRSPRSSPNILRGTNSKKRRISQLPNSPRIKKKSMSGSSAKDTANSTTTQKPAGASSSSTNPPIQLIPATAKRNSGFRFPLTRGP